MDNNMEIEAAQTAMESAEEAEPTASSLFEELGLDKPEEEPEPEENKTEEEAAQTPEEQQAPPEMELNVATDNMTAYLRVKPAFHGQKITYEFIHEYLIKNNIVYGICEEDIRNFCEKQEYYRELICARGLPPVDEENGTLKYHFRTESAVKPKEKEDGTVDFRDLGLVQNVSKGDVLCEIIPPEPGQDGIDVYDHVVRHTEGKLPPLPSGSQTIVSEDQLTLTAGIDGCIVYKNGVVNIEDVFVVRGNVDNTSGNIDFIGSVVIQGDVFEGFHVKAGANISIRGMSEGAFIEAGGDISISSGMNGMGKGKLTAGGNIVSKYFENVTIDCKGDVYADVIMNCIVTAEGSVILKGKKGLLIGGLCQAGQLIYANTIGGPNHVRTGISIVSDKLNEALYGTEKEDNLEELHRKLGIARKGAEKLQALIADLTKPNNEAQEKTQREKDTLKAAITKKAQFSALIGMLEKSIQKKEDAKQTFADFKVICMGITYPATKLTIANFVMNINNEYSNTKFYADGEHIVFAQILPSDKLS